MSFPVWGGGFMKNFIRFLGGVAAVASVIVGAVFVLGKWGLVLAVVLIFGGLALLWYIQYRAVQGYKTNGW